MAETPTSNIDSNLEKEQILTIPADLSSEEKNTFTESSAGAGTGTGTGTGGSSLGGSGVGERTGEGGARWGGEGTGPGRRGSSWGSSGEGSGSGKGGSGSGGSAKGTGAGGLGLEGEAVEVVLEVADRVEVDLVGPHPDMVKTQNLPILRKPKTKDTRGKSCCRWRFFRMAGWEKFL